MRVWFVFFIFFDINGFLEWVSRVTHPLGFLTQLSNSDREIDDGAFAKMLAAECVIPAGCVNLAALGPRIGSQVNRLAFERRRCSPFSIPTDATDADVAARTFDCHGVATIRSSLPAARFPLLPTLRNEPEVRLLAVHVVRITMRDAEPLGDFPVDLIREPNESQLPITAEND